MDWNRAQLFNAPLIIHTTDVSPDYSIQAQVAVGGRLLSLVALKVALFIWSPLMLIYVNGQNNTVQYNKNRVYHNVA